MFAEPTIDDFKSRVSWRLDSVMADAKSAIRKARRNAAITGSPQSGKAIAEVFKLSQQALESGIDSALAELNRAKQTTDLDHRTLRTVTESLLREFSERIKKSTKHEELRALGPTAKIDAFVSRLDQALPFRLRQFDVGFHDPDKPSGPILMSNNINIERMSGGAVQQGTTRSTQVSVGNIDIGSISGALTAFENAVGAAGLSEQEVQEIRADISTIRAQLAKSHPSSTILAEAGKSLRNITEGIVGGVLTSPLVTAAPALWRALGL